MECLYFEDFDADSSDIFIDGDEFKHIKALRVKTTDKIYISNGIGLVAEGIIEIINNHSSIIRILEIHQNFNEENNRIGLAIGVIENKDRFEFALEKSVELGITDFFPMITDYTAIRNVNTDRLKKKAIAALKQSKRAYLTNIHEAVNLNKCAGKFNTFENIFIADFDGKTIDRKIAGNTLFIIGPEGGFSTREREYLENHLNPTIINLGKRRLRAETAAIYCLSVFNYQRNISRFSNI
jgi:16S rRNA (uracil1498-N3)-methyltransferase